MSLELPSKTTTYVVRRIMLEKGIKQKDVANALGISEQGFSGKLHGRSSYTYKDIVILADLFNVSADILLGRDKLKVAR